MVRECRIVGQYGAIGGSGFVTVETEYAKEANGMHWHQHTYHLPSGTIDTLTLLLGKIGLIAHIL